MFWINQYSIHFKIEAMTLLLNKFTFDVIHNYINTLQRDDKIILNLNHVQYKVFLLAGADI